MNIQDIFELFNNSKGSNAIAGLGTLETVDSLIRKNKITSVLELGAGIGTISYCMLSIPGVYIDLFEPNEFCIGELNKKLNLFKDRYHLFKDYHILPTRLNYDLVVVDGGGGEEGSRPRTILAYLNWLESVKYIYVQGYRYSQRAFIRAGLRDRYTYRIIYNSDGITFVLKRTKPRLLREFCYIYWTLRENLAQRLRKSNKTVGI